MREMNGSDQSETTSLTPSSWPTSPKRSVPVYYVQSPSREWQEEDKSTNTPRSVPSPSESPSAQSRSSSGSRVSGMVLKVKGGIGKGGGVHERQWRVIEEEVEEDDVENGGPGENHRRRRVRVGLTLLVALFCFFCFVMWCSSRPFPPHVSLKKLIVSDFYTGQGSDWRGVPTTMLTVNCSLKMKVHNPATFFGIHVSSTSFNLMYYDLIVASGQIEEYYQQRKSWKNVTVQIEGNRVPLYGAGTGFAEPDDIHGVPLTLDFEFRTSGHVVGRLVKSNHHLRVSCSFAINLNNPKSVGFVENSCKYL